MVEVKLLMGQNLKLGDEAVVTILAIKGDQVRFGVTTHKKPRRPEPPAAEHESEVLTFRLGARLDVVERILIEAMLRHFGGNTRRAAEALGCSLKTLYNKLHGYARRKPRDQAE